MAKLYFDKLSQLIKSLKLDTEISKSLETKHFFSGAALYIDSKLCVSWSPVGLAFKLSEPEVDKLINSGKAIPLKYFPKGHIKKGYALFENPDQKKIHYWKKFFLSASKTNEC